MIDFISYIRQGWAKISPSDGQKGTVVDELAVKPTGLTMSEFYNKLVDIKETNDIANWKNMTDEELDDFASKFFIFRNTGKASTTTIRLYFNERVNVNIGSDVVANISDGTPLKPSKPQNISGNSLKTNNTPSYNYYVDIPFVSIGTLNTSYPAGVVNSIRGLNVDYASITNTTPIIGGGRYETNEEFYKRLINTNSDGSLLTKSGVYSLMANRFPSVKSVYVAGAGDKYMNRDYVNVNSDEDLKISFTGKIPNNTVVPHTAYKYIFPPIYESENYYYWNPFSSKSEYDYPLSIEPMDITYTAGELKDAALLGYDTSIEFSIDDYSGVYYNEFNSTFEYSTSPLYDIVSDSISYSSEIVVPNSKWTVGAHGRPSGDFGDRYSYALGNNLVYFKSGDTIVLKHGAKRAVTASVETTKRTGVKVSGTIKMPTIGDNTLYNKSLIQVMVAGTNDGSVDSFTGVGFGIIPITESSSLVFFSHSAKYKDSNIYANLNDFDENSGNLIAAGMNSIKEDTSEIKASSTYDFELILNDDLSVTLYIVESTTNASRYEFKMELPSTALKVYDKNGLTDPGTTKYGQNVLVTMDSKIDEIELSSTTDTYDAHITDWELSGLKVMDLNNTSPTALFKFDVTGIDSGVNIKLRAYANGVISDRYVEGYTAYIWNKEETNYSYTSNRDIVGAWKIMYTLSNPNNTKSNPIMFEKIADISNYIVKDGGREFLYMMIVPTGKSAAGSIYHNTNVLDTESKIVIDYVEIETFNKFKYHARNKADVYVSTISSREGKQAVMKNAYYDGVVKINMENGFTTPVDFIDTVTINTGAQEQVISGEDIVFIKVDDGFENSIYETGLLELKGVDYGANIVLKYYPYPSVDDIQLSINDSSNGSIYGDTVIKHKFAVRLSFGIQVVSGLGGDTILQHIYTYFDSELGAVFSIREFINYLYSVNAVTNVKEPLEISYSRDKVLGISDWYGSFKDSLTIRNIEYFDVGNITVEVM